MANASVEIRVVFAWWLKPYLTALVFFCLLCQREPDYSKLERVICRAMRFR